MSNLRYGKLNDTYTIPEWAKKYYPLATKDVDEEITPIDPPNGMKPIEGADIDKLLRHNLCGLPGTEREPWYGVPYQVRKIICSNKKNLVGLFPGTITGIEVLATRIPITHLSIQVNTNNGIIKIVPIVAKSRSQRMFTVGENILVAYCPKLETPSLGILGFYSPCLQTGYGTIAGVGSKTVTVNYTDPWVGTNTPITATVQLTGMTLKKGDIVSFLVSNAVQLRPTDKLQPKITNIVKTSLPPLPPPPPPSVLTSIVKGNVYERYGMRDYSFSFIDPWTNKQTFAQATNIDYNKFAAPGEDAVILTIQNTLPARTIIDVKLVTPLV